MFLILTLSLAILSVCVVLLSVQILLKKGGQFPNTHVGSNKALKAKGVYCAKTQDWQAGREKGLFDRMKEGAM